MVSFDALAPGTLASDWDAAAPWSGAAEVDLSSIRRLVVIAAHPDDESLGAGGLIARAASAGIAVSFIVVTDGEHSHPDAIGISPGELGLIRRGEFREAVAGLAPDATVQFVGVPDGATEPHAARVLALLLGALRDEDPAHLLVLAPWSGDGHRDHRVVGQLVEDVAAARQLTALAYPIWMWHWAATQSHELPWRSSTIVSMTDREQRQKASAISAHRSQVQGLAEEDGLAPILSPEVLDHFHRGIEVFFSVGRSDDHSVGEAYFTDLYRRHEDPWGYDDRWYEERKRALTVAALPRRHFRSGLEVGCGIGALTADLADRCERLLGVDVAAEAVARARRRLADRRVEIRQATMPADWPDGPFDLIVLSEIGYYWDRQDLGEAIRAIDRTLSDDGTVLLCHWRWPVVGCPQTGDEVHAVFERNSSLMPISRHLEEDFILTVYARPQTASLARREGLV